MMMKIPTYTLKIIFSAVIILGNSSCFQKPVAPEFNGNADAILRKIMSVGGFKNMSITSSSEKTNMERTYVQLDIRMIDGDIRSYSQEQLDSLARLIAAISKQHIKNWNDYDWTNIIFATSDGSAPSDSSKKSVFVFRPSETSTDFRKKL